MPAGCTASLRAAVSEDAIEWGETGDWDGTAHIGLSLAA